MNDERTNRAPPEQAVDADALHRAGLLSLRQGQLERGRQQLERAVAARPRSTSLHNDLGSALGSLGRFDEACAAFRTACEIDPHNADALFNLGCVLHELDRPQEAVQAFRNAVAANPAFDDARIELARGLRRLGRAAESVEVFEGVSHTGLQVAEVQLELAGVLAEKGDARASESAYRRCLQLAPNLVSAHTALGSLLMEARRFDEAVACFERAAALRPGLAETHFNLGAVLLASGNARAALAALERSQTIEPAATRALALKTIALCELGERDAVVELAGFDGFVRTRRIDPPSGFADLAAYNAALAGHVLGHPSLEHDPGRHATRKGLHSGNLLAEPKGPVAALETAIKEAVLGYVQSLPRASRHPFAAAAPRRMGMEAWGVVLGAGGHQILHIHPGAWLSGVYYVRVPQAVDERADEREGWFEFSCAHPNYPTTVEPHGMVLKPYEGLLVLFPSYLYHRTVPFETGETRISIAFDIYPDEG